MLACTEAVARKDGMSTADVVDVASFIDERHVSRAQLGVGLICALVLLCDNMDLQAIAYSGPSLMSELGLQPGELGRVFSAGLFGMALGAVIFGPLADRFGRRTVMVVSVPLFAVFTVLTAFADTTGALVLLRFLAGLGFGGAMPNAMSLIAEYLPTRTRLTWLGLFASGFTLGGAVAGFIAAPVVTQYGWRAVYLIDGGLSLVVAVLVWLYLPESLRFMASRPGRAPAIRKMLGRIDPRAAIAPDARYTEGAAVPKRTPVILLFTQGRAWITLPLWITSFCFLLDIYFVVNWTPILARQNGIPLGKALLAPALFQVGATVAGLSVGFLMNRLRPQPVMVVLGLAASLSVAALGYLGGEASSLLALSAVCGLFVVGSQTAANLSATTLVPTAIRTTSIGWVLGVGRIGSFVGPLLGGALLAAHWAPWTLFLFAAVPPLVAAVAALALATGAARAAISAGVEAERPGQRGLHTAASIGADR